jgi:hypothetical protein
MEYALNCNLEITPMIRTLGLTLWLVVPLCLATMADAQTTPYNGGGAPNPYSGVSVYGSLPYGGFGLEYSQAFPAGGMIMDQYGLWHAVPGVQSAPAVAAAQPQPRSRPARSSSRRIPAKVAQPRYQLPTGSLGLSTADGGMLYSPVTHYRSYGSGYAFPAGVIDHSGMWWGMPSY